MKKEEQSTALVEKIKQTENISGLREFTAAINAKPDNTKVNKLVQGKPLYLPIGEVEKQLDHYYNGLWNAKNFKYQVIVNELVGDLELQVFHPVARVWLSRAGCGAVMIQQQKGSEITNIEAKIKNTLQKDIGHLKAECIKNAAKSLGEIFGRNLNRDIEDGLANVDQVDDIITSMRDCEDPSELRNYFKDLPKIWQKDRRVINMFRKKRIELESVNKKP